MPLLFVLAAKHLRRGITQQHSGSWLWLNTYKGCQQLSQTNLVDGWVWLRKCLSVKQVEQLDWLAALTCETVPMYLADRLLVTFLWIISEFSANIQLRVILWLLASLPPLKDVMFSLLLVCLLGGLLVERRTSVSQIRGSIPGQVAAV